MTPVTEIALSRRPRLDEPISSHRVEEGYYVIAKHTPETPTIHTCGLYVCKGIVIHSPEEQIGLVAHLSAVKDLNPSLDRIAKAINLPLDRTDITLVGASSSTAKIWPDIEMVADFFLEREPRQLMIDRNPDEVSIRGIALHLGTGKTSEIHPKMWSWNPRNDTTRNKPISTTPVFS